MTILLHTDMTVHLTAQQYACWRPCDRAAAKYRRSFIRGLTIGLKHGATVAIASPLGETLFVFTAGCEL